MTTRRPLPEGGAIEELIFERLKRRGPLSCAQLCADLVLTPDVAGETLDSMRRGGLVERRQDPRASGAAAIPTWGPRRLHLGARRGEESS